MIVHPLRQTVDSGGVEIVLNQDATGGLHPAREITDRTHRHPPLHPHQSSSINCRSLDRIKAWKRLFRLETDLLEQLPGVEPVHVELGFELPPDRRLRRLATPHMRVDRHRTAHTPGALQ